ncbi:lantibiotic dehydratase [Sphaerisporangium siamense]|uniref:Lantibiotic dehydratase N-terminal domain-containing protein n=1 Tax=Sphaerisporangium siamense TaxID=795645 RepID=A0A7W7GBF4_9ACTN|nr:lantibiotic dehydratase [Sphaerisporangium siamense]MBB4702384.1 hypothetical protein [Sphaerisporangium siamense]
MLDAQEALTAAADAAVAHLRDSEDVTDGKLRRKLWKTLSRHRPLPDPAETAGLPSGTRTLLDEYARALDRLARTEREARATFDAELPARRTALRDLASDERFQEAVWLSSPQMYDRGLRGYVASDVTTARTSRTRSLERQLAGYLQRVSAKNETTSFFGPINYGTFTTPAPAPLPNQSPHPTPTHAPSLHTEAPPRPEAPQPDAPTTDAPRAEPGAPLPGQNHAAGAFVVGGDEGRGGGAAPAHEPSLPTEASLTPEAPRSEAPTADAPRADPGALLLRGQGHGARTFAVEGEETRGGGAGVVVRRHAYVAYWVVRGLADRIAAEPDVRPHLRPRLSTLARLSPDGTAVTLVRTRTFALKGRAAALAPLVDGKRTATELARETGIPVAEVVAELDRLAKGRVVAFGVDLPVTEPRALEALRDRVAELPDDCPAREVWLSRLDGLRGLQEEFAASGFERRRELLEILERQIGELTGQDTRRAGGQLYADRLVITEECLGAVTPLHLGEDVLRLLTDELAPVLDLLAAEAVRVHAHLTATALNGLNLAEGDRLPLPAYLAHSWPTTLTPPSPAPTDGAPNSEDPEPHQAETPGMWRAVIDERVDAAEYARPPRDRTHAATAGDAPAATGRVELEARDVAVDPEVLAGRALICSPDVMIVARDLDAVRAGDFTLVLAESHDTVLLWGWALQFMDDPGATQGAIGGLLARLDTHRPLANMLTSKRAKIVPFEFPGATVEASQPSSRADGRTIPVGEVDVVVRDGRLTLSAPGQDGFLLYNGELDSPAHNALAPPRVRPVAFGRAGLRHTPRVTVGRTVLQRERWLIAREELVPEPARGGDDASFALLVALRQAVRRHGLPRWVFVKIPGERKPVLLDTEGLFLTELVAHLSEQGADLGVSEMLPGPGDLWLHGSGGAHCSELRLTAVRTAPASPGDAHP